MGLKPEGLRISGLQGLRFKGLRELWGFELCGDKGLQGLSCWRSEWASGLKDQSSDFAFWARGSWR